MTKKRYKLIKADPCEPYDCRMYVGILEDDVKELYDYKSICDRLNELSEENEEFNEELMEYDSFKRLYEEKIERFEKENEQLKKELEFWKKLAEQCPMRS